MRKNFIIVAVLLCSLCAPMLDAMVCADCLGNTPFRGGVTISHMKTSHIDVSYSKKGQTQPNTGNEQSHKSFCPICANVLMGVDVHSPQVHASVAQNNGAPIAPPLSELHYSIHKPPPNSLV